MTKYQGFLAAGTNSADPVVLLGLPYDGTTTFRPGTRFAPPAIRQASYGLESYCPRLQRDLTGKRYTDLGDAFVIGVSQNPVALIQQYLDSQVQPNQKILAFGGEHLVSLPLIRRANRLHPGLWVIHFDAHADLAQEYLGLHESHATVLRRTVEFVSPDRLAQFGIRSGSAEEWRFMREHNTQREDDPEDQIELRERIGDAPVYVTLDVDILDPSVMPGTGTPEPGGWDYARLENALLALDGLNIVGADIVEVAPAYDPSGISAITAAKLARTLLLMM